MSLSALVVAHNEEERLAACLERLAFADEIVVVLDRCTDGSRAVAARFTDRLVEGAWEREGGRRNAGIAACRGPWVLEVDADEHVTPALAQEIRAVAAVSKDAIHLIPVDNWVGGRLVRYGWGAGFGKSAYPGLFRKEAKRWGDERVHPRLTLAGSQGPPLRERLQHYVDRDISDMIRRFDRYTSARALDLLDGGAIGPVRSDVRRLFSRTWKCFVRRGGWREGTLGLLIAVLAGLYPLVSNLKARERAARAKGGGDWR